MCERVVLWAGPISQALDAGKTPGRGTSLGALADSDLSGPSATAQLQRTASRHMCRPRVHNESAATAAAAAAAIFIRADVTPYIQRDSANDRIQICLYYPAMTHGWPDGAVHPSAGDPERRAPGLLTSRVTRPPTLFTRAP